MRDIWYSTPGGVATHRLRTAAQEPCLAGFAIWRLSVLCCTKQSVALARLHYASTLILDFPEFLQVYKSYHLRNYHSSNGLMLHNRPDAAKECWSSSTVTTTMDLGERHPSERKESTNCLELRSKYWEIKPLLPRRFMVIWEMAWDTKLREI